MKFSSTGSCLFSQWVCYRDAIHLKVADHLSPILFFMDTEGPQSGVTLFILVTDKLTAATLLYRTKYSTVFLSPIYSGMCNWSFMCLKKKNQGLEVITLASCLTCASDSIFKRSKIINNRPTMKPLHTLVSQRQLKHTVHCGSVQQYGCKTVLLLTCCDLHLLL